MKLTKLATAVSMALTVNSIAYAASPDLSVTRIIDDNDIGAAKTCFIMSDTLNSNAEQVKPYVAIKNLDKGTEQTSNIMIDDRSLCLTDLSFGTNYLVTLKKGFTSANNASLKNDYERKIKTSDQSAYFNLLPGNIISSASSDKKIAVESVNYPEYKVFLFKDSLSDLASYSDWSNFYESTYRYSLVNGLLEHSKFIGGKTYKVAGTINQKQISFIDLNDFGENIPAGIYEVMVTSNKAPDCDASLNCLDDFYDDEVYPMLLRKIIVSDIGVTTYKSNSSIDIATRSLQTGKPMSGAKATLISSANEVLETVITDGDGYAHFSFEKLSGKGAQLPIMITVSKDNDFYAVDLRKMPLTLEDVKASYSNKNNPNFNVYAYLNRTLVRPGEKVFYEALVRNGKLKSSDVKALKLMIYRPDGMLFKEAALGNPKAGAFSYELELDESCNTGEWRFDLGFDKNNVISSNTLSVASFIPSSIEPIISFANDIVTLQDELKIYTKYTYNAPAPDIQISGELSVAPDHHPVAKYKDYYFGPNEDQDSELIEHYNYNPAQTDETGHHAYTFENISVTNYAQDLTFTVNFTDPNSKLITKTLTKKLLKKEPLIGFKADFAKENRHKANLSVIVSDQLGNLYAGQVNYRIFKHDVSYQFAYINGRWEYLRNDSKKPILSGTLDVKADLSALINHDFDFGDYIIELDGLNAATSANFVVGSQSDFNPEYPDRFELFADQKSYKPGQDLSLEFDSAYDGFADLMIDSSNKLIHFKINKGHNKINAELPKNFNQGGYALLSTYAAEGNKYLGAIRSIGVTYLSYNDEDDLLKISTDLPETIKPNTGVDINIKVDGADDDTYVTATLIDNGILSINKQKSPQPERYIYNSQEFNTKIFDDYGYVMKNIDHTGQGYGGDGDDIEGSLDSLSNITKNLMSYYSNEVKVVDGVAKVHFDLNDLSSTAKFSVSAWSKDKLGSLSQDVGIKDNTVSKLSMPNFLHAGDVINSKLLINNLKSEPAKYSYAVTCSGALACNLSGSIDVGANAELGIPLDVTAKSSGEGYADIKVDGPNYSFATKKDYEVLSPFAKQVENKIVVLKPKENRPITLANSFAPNTEATVHYGKLPLSDTKKIMDQIMNSDYYRTVANAAAGLAALDLLVSLEKEDSSDQEYRNQLAKYVDGQVTKVIMKIGAGDSYLNEYFTNYQNNNYAYAYAAIFLIKAHKAGFNINNSLIEDLYRGLSKLATSDSGAESENIAALAMTGLMQMGENVKSNAIYMFDHLFNKDAVSLEALALYAEIFKSYGDNMRHKKALAEAEKLAANVYKKLNPSLAGNSTANVLTLFANLAKVMPFEANDFTHDVLALIRAKVHSNETDDLETLYNYLSVDTNVSIPAQAILVELASSPEAKEVSPATKINVVGKNVAIANPTAEKAVATLIVDGDVTSQSFSKVANAYQEFYDINGKELRGPISIGVNDELLVVNRIVFGSNYTGDFSYSCKIPANTILVGTLDETAIHNKYPNLKNIKFASPNALTGDTSIYFTDFVNKTTSIAFAYVIKGAHRGKSVPLMNSGYLKQAVNIIFNSYKPEQTITVK